MNSLDGAFAGFAALGSMAMLLPFGLLGLVFPYLALRLRQVPPDQQDPQVGLKCALYFVYSLGILMFLIGLSVLVVDLMVRGDWFTKAAALLEKFDSTHRNAASLMASGGLFAFFHLLLIMGFTNNHSFPEVRRVWVGWRFAIHSLIVLACVTSLIFVVFAENSRERDMQMPLALLIVWGPSWFLHLILLKAYRGAGSPPVAVRKRRTEEDDDGGERPARPVQPQRPAPAAPAQQQQQQQRPAPGAQQPAPRPAPGQQRPAPGVQRPPQRRPLDE